MTTCTYKALNTTAMVEINVCAPSLMRANMHMHVDGPGAMANVPESFGLQTAAPLSSCLAHADQHGGYQLQRTR